MELLQHEGAFYNGQGKEKKAQNNWLVGRVEWFIFQNEGRDRNKSVKVT